jgi:hypothetical protein
MSLMTNEGFHALGAQQPDYGLEILGPINCRASGKTKKVRVSGSGEIFQADFTFLVSRMF